MVNPVKPWTFARHSVGLLEKIDVFFVFFFQISSRFHKKIGKIMKLDESNLIIFSNFPIFPTIIIQ